MVQEEAYEKISSTAKLVAHIRSFTDIPFTKEIAAASGAETDFQTLTGKSAEFMKIKNIPVIVVGLTLTLASFSSTLRKMLRLSRFSPALLLSLGVADTFLGLLCWHFGLL